MMEYKKCEHCGEQIHIRSKKCPFCNEIVAEVPEKIEEEVPENISEEQENGNENSEEPIKTYDELKSQADIKPNINFSVGNEEPKDYVYKAEVRHSIEYVEPMSNWFKVFISALCTFPIIGQLVGSFLGVYFVTYEDTDRKAFGKALITLSIIMFFIYCAYVSQVMTLIEGLDLDALYNAIGQ